MRNYHIYKVTSLGSDGTAYWKSFGVLSDREIAIGKTKLLNSEVSKGAQYRFIVLRFVGDEAESVYDPLLEV